MKMRRSRLKLGRAMCWGILCGALGAVGTFGALLAYALIRWVAQVDRHVHVGVIDSDWLVPVITCTTLCACAGWAAFVPLIPRRFTPTFLIICLLSLSIWLLGTQMVPPAPRRKVMEHPRLDCWRLIGITGPPVIAALVLTVIRRRGAFTVNSHGRHKGDRSN